VCRRSGRRPGRPGRGSRPRSTPRRSCPPTQAQGTATRLARQGTRHRHFLSAGLVRCHGGVGRWIRPEPPFVSVCVSVARGRRGWVGPAQKPPVSVCVSCGRVCVWGDHLSSRSSRRCRSPRSAARSGSPGRPSGDQAHRGHSGGGHSVLQNQQGLMSHPEPRPPVR
jgi:hypothetical protein